MTLPRPATRQYSPILAELTRQLQERDREIAALILRIDDQLPIRGVGSPEGAIQAQVGALYIRTDGGAGTTLYVKESGSEKTGWAAK